MEIVFGLGVLCVCFTLFWSAKMSSNALAAALAALTAAVGRIGADVSETVQAIRDHINGDAGISADTLSGLTDRLSAAADALESVKADAAAANAQPDPLSEPAPAAPAELTPAPEDFSSAISEPATPATEPPVDAPAPDVGNQNGVGSDFTTGVDGLTDAGSTPDTAATGDPAIDSGERP